MSRVSSKSALSPSATNGSSSIDLGKDSGVNLGEKTQTSVSTGGIGVTREVANIGGMSVTGGVSVEVSPIRLDISGNVDYEDPTKNSVSIGAGAEVPGGLLGISGGVTINTTTGAIEEVSIGGEIVGVGVNVSKGDDGWGLGISLQIPFTPIEINLGFGFPNDKKQPTSTPTPTPTPTPSTNNKMPSDWQPSIPSAPASIVAGKKYYVRTTTIAADGSSWYSDGSGFYIYTVTPPQTGNLNSPTVSPSSEPKFCQSSTQRQIDLMTIIPGSIGYLQAGPSYYNIDGPNINKIIIYSAATYVAPFGTISQIVETYYRRCVTINHPGFENAGYPGTYWFGPTKAGRIFSLSPGSIYNPFNALPNRAEGYTWKFLEYELISKTIIELIECGQVLPPPPFSTPFPNPPPRKENMDECCRLSIRLLRAIYTGLGIAKFPGKLPATIIQQIPKKGQMPAEPAQVIIADFVDLLDWQFKRDDERWGQWEVQIDIKDSDLTKEGDQSKSIKLPNLAESIAEIEGQLLSVMTNVDALVAMQTKCLVESGMARQEAIKGYLASKAIIKYMAFKSAEIDVTVPMTFTPGAESISALVKESEGHIKGTDYVEKETLRDILLDLLQAAAVIRAVHWQKIDSKTDTKSQLLNILKGSVDLASSIAKPKSPNGNNEAKFDPTQNFEDFIDSVEDGFRNTTGITDIQNPYGKTPDRRPRIRQIGDNISQAGGDK